MAKTPNATDDSVTRFGGELMKQEFNLGGNGREVLDAKGILNLILVAYTALKNFELNVPVYLPLYRFQIRTTLQDAKRLPVFSKRGIEQSQEEMIIWLDELMRTRPSGRFDLRFVPRAPTWILVAFGLNGRYI